MDWPKDSAGLSQNESALHKVFKYNPSPSLVIEVLQSNFYEPRVSAFATDAQWTEWAKAINYRDPGLVLVLATRVGSQATLEKNANPISIDEWLKEANKVVSTPFETRRSQILSPLAEKPEIVEKPIQQGVRTVPFSAATFKLLSNSLRIHESIARTVSRSDVATFTVDEVDLYDPALVYSCRTSNAWDMDLALSQTHYPRDGLSLSVLYGCDLSTNREVLRRLHLVGEQAAHPLLMPGILAEIELVRQTSIVETDIIAVETKILELDVMMTPSVESSSLAILQKRVDKRSAWLDLAYLRDSLIHWNTQLKKMAEHADEFKSGIHRELEPRQLDELEINATTTLVSRHIRDPNQGMLGHSLNHSMEDCEGSSVSEKPEDNVESNNDLILAVQSPPQPGSPGSKHFARQNSNPPCYDLPHTLNGDRDYVILVVGDKIRRRLLVLQSEFDEMIRSCTMRLDGMAMATQWSYSETNVEIASATRRDSRIMKSISLVTMIFLPGTFFATIFSMSFFDWFGEKSPAGTTQISSYIWIYVVITAFFTAITVAAWYYFVVLRRRFKATKAMDSAV